MEDNRSTRRIWFRAWRYGPIWLSAIPVHWKGLAVYVAAVLGMVVMVDAATRHNLNQLDPFFLGGSGLVLVCVVLFLRHRETVDLKSRSDS